MKFTQRDGLFLLATAIALWMLYGPLRNFLHSSQGSELYSHIILIPLISAYLFFVDRKAIFSDPAHSYAPGIVLSVTGLMLFLAGTSQQPALNQPDYASVITLSAAIFWTGTLMLLYGIKAFRTATFPILFLLFMVPIPSALMNEIISVLQIGSAQMGHLLFLLVGMPFSREGLVFHLPGASIEVAAQCSGIHSSLALLITSVLAAHFFLQATWKRAVLVLCVLPVAIFKNAVRIVTISWLSVYVDERILAGGFLHRSGGFLFFALGVVVLGIVLILLRRIGKDNGFAIAAGSAGDTGFSSRSEL